MSSFKATVPVWLLKTVTLAGRFTCPKGTVIPYRGMLVGITEAERQSEAQNRAESDKTPLITALNAIARPDIRGWEAFVTTFVAS
jgi:hypothetical protein